MLRSKVIITDGVKEQMNGVWLKEIVLKDLGAAVIEELGATVFNDSSSTTDIHIMIATATVAMTWSDIAITSSLL